MSDDYRGAKGCLVAMAWMLVLGFGGLWIWGMLAHGLRG
jgi:hypothetical protein